VLGSIRKRLTYANVMATLAVFIALGGVGYAAIKLPKNSVGTRQLKNRAVTTKKINKSTLKKLKGTTGPQGPAGTPIRWALVDSAGNVVGSSGGVTKATIPGQDSSQYFLDFHTAVTNRPILVSPSYGATTAFADTLLASPCGGNGTTPGSIACGALPGGDNDHTVFVLSLSDGNLSHPQGFYVAVFP
jgi:hypothetical protein